MIDSRINPPNTASSSPRTWGRSDVTAAAALIVWSVLMLWLCAQQGVQHDYRSYLGQWRLLLDGANPWSTDNNYGPLHTVVGFLLPFGQLAPKFLLVGALLIANAALVFSLLRERGVGPILIIYLLAVPTNVLVVGVGIIYGLNDALVASLLVAAVLFRTPRQFSRYRHADRPGGARQILSSLATAVFCAQRKPAALVRYRQRASRFLRRDGRCVRDLGRGSVQRDSSRRNTKNETAFISWPTPGNCGQSQDCPLA